MATKAKPRTIPVPKTREPFVNTPLLALGPGEDGKERFWISTWNSLMGTTGVLVTEDGDSRQYRFKPPHGGFYSAVQSGRDTLWLCGDLSRVVRLDLPSGKSEIFETGAPSALMFQGMILDKKTGKLFAAAFPPPTTMAFSFNTRTCKPVKVYRDFTEGHYMRSSFPNGDDTWSATVVCPAEYLLHWDPKKETLESRDLRQAAGAACAQNGAASYLMRLMERNGEYYFPNYGWFTPSTRTFHNKGPVPEQEAIWMRSTKDYAIGTLAEGCSTNILRWTFADGKVSKICTLSDRGSINFTKDGKIVVVNMYGFFQRYDETTGALECSRDLQVTNINTVDCLCRIDDDRLLGTPFITQRFWQTNLKTGEGEDLGRAAPGGGEILETWKIGKKVYMAAYTGGELMEYDPEKSARFPENPRVVADPPGGMRPVAQALHKNVLYYACSAPYGNTGSVITRYNAKSGNATYHQDALPECQIQSLFLLPKKNLLFCGSTIDADCQSCPPTAKAPLLGWLDADSLAVRATCALPETMNTALVLGPLRKERFLLVGCTNDGQYPYGIVSANAPAAPASWQDLPWTYGQAKYAGTPGMYILHTDNRLELWDLDTMQKIRLLHTSSSRKEPFYRIHIQGKTVYVIYPRHIEILEDVL